MLALFAVFAWIAFLIIKLIFNMRVVPPPVEEDNLRFRQIFDYSMDTLSPGDSIVIGLLSNYTPAKIAGSNVDSYLPAKGMHTIYWHESYVIRGEYKFVNSRIVPKMLKLKVIDTRNDLEDVIWESDFNKEDWDTGIIIHKINKNADRSLLYETTPISCYNILQKAEDRIIVFYYNYTQKSAQTHDGESITTSVQEQLITFNKTHQQKPLSFSGRFDLSPHILGSKHGSDTSSYIDISIEYPENDIQLQFSSSNYDYKTTNHKVSHSNSIYLYDRHNPGSKYVDFYDLKETIVG